MRSTRRPSAPSQDSSSFRRKTVMFWSNMITRDQEEFALQDLRRSRAAVDKLVAPASGGVYAIFLRSPGLLAPFVEGDDGLIYIGSSSNLADREFEQHFSSKSTGFSTLRRSVGALLRSVLVLKAIPRAPGP